MTINISTTDILIIGGIALFWFVGLPLIFAVWQLHKRRKRKW